MGIELDVIADLARYGITVGELVEPAPAVPADDAEGV